MRPGDRGPGETPGAADAAAGRARLHALLAQLRGSRTDLARIVESAARSERPFVVVPAGALRAWQEREPSAWSEVRDWLAARGQTIVESSGRGAAGRTIASSDGSSSD